MLGTASLAFRQSIPEAIGALVQAMREYPQQPLGRPAHTTGATERSFAGTANDEEMNITGAAHMQALITGRRPTTSSTSSGQKLSEILALWAENKGLVLKRGQTYKGLGYVIARRIHAEGTALFRAGGHSGIIQSVLTKDWLTTLKARLAAGEMVAISTALTHAIQGK